MNKLTELYLKTSKHSNYQIPASNIEPLLDTNLLKIKSRYEKERFEFICNNIDLRGKRVIDIGGNTGFFTFEAYNEGALSVDYYEGNKVHAEFVEEAANQVGLSEKINVHPSYYLFDSSDNSSIYDVAFLLNVVHHLHK